jgi:hypothetical protein
VILHRCFLSRLATMLRVVPLSTEMPLLEVLDLISLSAATHSWSLKDVVC